MHASVSADRLRSRVLARRIMSAILGVMLALSGPEAARAQQTAVVSGTVRDAAGLAVPAAAVELRHAATDEVRTQTTGADGTFRFTAVAPGRHELRVAPDGYREATATVMVEAAQTREVDVALEQVFTVEQIVVTGTRDERELGDVAAAVGVVGRREIQRGKAMNLEESLKRVPGVRVEDELGTAHRTRIIVRGVGTRANNPAGSGVRGVKVLVDGIPKNNAGGSAQDLINIDLESIGRMEVLKGPSSALYGNQSGGVVNLITETPPDTPTREYRAAVGSFGLQRHHVKLAGRSGDGAFSYVASGFRTQQDGYRDHSNFHSTGFHGKLDYSIDDRSSLSTILGYDHSFERSPGPLTAEQMAEDPRQAAPVFLEGDTRATVEELRFGLVYRRQLRDSDELEVTGFYTPRRLAPFVQIGVRIPQDFTNRGASLRYVHGGPVAGHENRLSIGAEFQNTPITTGVFSTETGEALSELEENATTYGIYVLEEFNLHDDLLLSAGGRYDRIHFTSRNLILPGAPEAERTYERATPKVGLTYTPSSSLSLYTTYSRGFEAPIIGELRVVPGGEFGFNQGLEPQTLTNYELGARGQPFPWLTFQSAAYRQSVRNLITPVGTFPRNSYENVGRVSQYGLELSSDVQLARGVGVLLTYTLSDFTIEEFEVDSNDLSGNRLPGVPHHDVFGELSYRHPSGFGGALNAHHVGRFYFDNANSASNDPYTVVNVRADYEGDAGGLRIAPFLGVNNLGDASYSAFALINDEQRRFYNPLPGINAFGGLRVTF